MILPITRLWELLFFAVRSAQLWSKNLKGSRNNSLLVQTEELATANEQLDTGKLKDRQNQKIWPHWLTEQWFQEQAAQKYQTTQLKLEYLKMRNENKSLTSTNYNLQMMLLFPLSSLFQGNITSDISKEIIISTLDVPEIEQPSHYFSLVLNSTIFPESKMTH